MIISYTAMDEGEKRRRGRGLYLWNTDWSELSKIRIKTIQYQREMNVSLVVVRLFESKHSGRKRRRSAEKRQQNEKQKLTLPRFGSTCRGEKEMVKNKRTQNKNKAPLVRSESSQVRDRKLHVPPTGNDTPNMYTCIRQYMVNWNLTSSLISNRHHLTPSW